MSAIGDVNADIAGEINKCNCRTQRFLRFSAWEKAHGVFAGKLNFSEMEFSRHMRMCWVLHKECIRAQTIDGKVRGRAGTRLRAPNEIMQIVQWAVIHLKLFRVRARASICAVYSKIPYLEFAWMQIELNLHCNIQYIRAFFPSSKCFLLKINERD